MKTLTRVEVCQVLLDGGNMPTQDEVGKGTKSMIKLVEVC